MLETITSTVIQAVTAFALLVPVRFPAPEVLVGFGRKGLIPTGIHDVADFKRLFDEKITGVYIPIVFNDKILAAVTPHVTCIDRALENLLQNGIKKTDGDPVNIVRIPIIKQRAEKFAPFPAVDGNRQQFAVFAEFNTGDVLLKKETLACQILINLTGLIYVGFADKRQYIEFIPTPL